MCKSPDHFPGEAVVPLNQEFNQNCPGTDTQLHYCFTFWTSLNKTLINVFVLVPYWTADLGWEKGLRLREHLAVVVFYCFSRQILLFLLLVWRISGRMKEGWRSVRNAPWRHHSGYKRQWHGSARASIRTPKKVCKAGWPNMHITGEKQSLMMLHLAVVDSGITRNKHFWLNEQMGKTGAVNSFSQDSSIYCW